MKLKKDKSSFGKKLLNKIQIYQKKQDSGFHQHRLHQLLIVEKGVFLIDDSLSRQVLFDQKIALIPARTLHRTIALGEQVKFHSIYFSFTLVNEKSNRVHLMDSNPLFRSLIISLEKRRKNDEIFTICLELIGKLLEEALQSQQLYGLVLPVSKEERNQKIISYIDSHFQNKIQLEDFQNVLPLSTKQIDRIFRSELKISPLDYLKMKRIQMAVILLETSNLTITEIAYESGYESLSSFYAHFEELVGTPPKKFQRGIKEIR